VASLSSTGDEDSRGSFRWRGPRRFRRCRRSDLSSGPSGGLITPKLQMSIEWVKSPQPEGATTKIDTTLLLLLVPNPS
jgi:hypothetical protein